ncbi:MAG: protein-L-isoaspartate(D-aspartate) O-methyltransferase [Patescibacteria group bacterium]|jgi:protein-L-isoaspartate(D-aspartate) O-methyltransferase
MAHLVEDLIHKGALSSEPVIAAFRKVRRQDFVHQDMLLHATEDTPLPIAHGQTISQPSTVATMLELLHVQPGDRVLEVGCGSGWLTALLAELVGSSGFVYAIDIIPQLVDLTMEHLEKYKFTNVEVKWGNGWEGNVTHAPYNRIIVSAGAVETPSVLVDQLARGGRLVVPVGGDVQDLVVVEKRSDGKVDTEKFPGYQFVPLVGEVTPISIK